ncbi:hypothetical protein [Streptomyces sp. TLI_146]|uniref:hypothetical protein n=1 Tax=Streptomyces sp. TLI_146 TaxID=1938858 RepID=UPI000C70A654|nr:hypothetical protein [Streptomyces sp. TLI_146]PKV82684.1 hypothetical protein BX283_0129 [Streptomyces sp. TLI_146]
MNPRLDDPSTVPAALSARDGGQRLSGAIATSKLRALTDEDTGASAPKIAARVFTGDEKRVLHLVAQGRSGRELADGGFFPTEKSAVLSVAQLGRILSGGAYVRWSRIVHLAVSQQVVAIEPAPPLDLPTFQLDLLRAYAAGSSLEEYVHRSSGAVSRCEARELRYLLCHSLGASGSANAVYLGHLHGALDHDPAPPLLFGAISLPCPVPAGRVP